MAQKLKGETWSVSPFSNAAGLGILLTYGFNTTFTQLSCFFLKIS